MAEARCGDRDTGQFQTWLAHHTNCNRNYHGASGYVGMEIQAAEMLWDRSLYHGFSYTTILPDDDSRILKHLTEMTVCGEYVTIIKDKCKNHITKRMETALRKLARQTKMTGVTFGSHGHGQLKGPQSTS